MNNTFKYLAVAAVAAAAIAGAIYLTSTKTSESPTPSPTATVSGRPCTLEAKVCPDGSTVGRVGPNCEFAPCSTPIRTTVPAGGSGY